MTWVHDSQGGRHAQKQLLVVGISPLGRLTGNELQSEPKRRALVGYLRFPREAPHERLHAPLIGTVSDLQAVLKERVVDEVYLASTSAQDTQLVQAAIDTCETLGTPFALPMSGYRFTRAAPRSRAAFADGYIHFSTVKGGRVQAAMKRSVDVLLSLAALVVLSPLLLAVALAVIATSRGPVLFKQPRVGLHGRVFRMLKFRSMVADAERLKASLTAQNEQSGPVFKMRRDPRVTTVGRFIRRFSIDELPQIVNVLVGDMSIVGPRPPLPAEVEKYETWQRRRLSVRPGLTCMWQVSGRNDIPFERWMKLDLAYIDHWNLLSDFELIARTVPVVLTGRGAS